MFHLFAGLFVSLFVCLFIFFPIFRREIPCSNLRKNGVCHYDSVQRKGQRDYPFWNVFLKARIRDIFTGKKVIHWN